MLILLVLVLVLVLLLLLLLLFQGHHDLKATTQVLSKPVLAKTRAPGSY